MELQPTALRKRNSDYVARWVRLLGSLAYMLRATGAPTPMMKSEVAKYQKVYAHYCNTDNDCVILSTLAIYMVVRSPTSDRTTHIVQGVVQNNMHVKLLINM